jgi:hypothetical protein
MSSPRRLSAVPLRLVASAARPVRRLTATPQMSLANGFEGRGRCASAARHRVGRLSARTVTFARPTDRDAFMEAWAKFVKLSCVTRTECVRVYDVTFQTACNWFNAERVPTGDKVSHAFTVAPNLAEQLLTGVR